MVRRLALLKVFAPLVVEPGEDFELLLEVEFLGVLGLAASGLDLHLLGLRKFLFEGGVLLHLLLNQRAQFEDGDLQELQGLAQLGRQHHQLALLLSLG